jgi:hypothetical protein
MDLIKIICKDLNNLLNSNIIIACSFLFLYFQHIKSTNHRPVLLISKMFIVAILLCCNTLAFKLNKFNTSRLKKQIFAQSFSISTKSPRVLVPVADGSEEIETTTIIDTLVRGGAVSSIFP